MSDENVSSNSSTIPLSALTSPPLSSHKATIRRNNQIRFAVQQAARSLVRLERLGIDVVEIGVRDLLAYGRRLEP